MIKDFWVENYYSIKDRQEMDFEVRPSEEEWMRVEAAHGVYLSKLAVIYGANASGKSNMLKALQNIFDLLFTARTNRNDKVLSGHPFALTADEPTRMYVSFYTNGIRYDYTIEYNQRYIISEKLDYYPRRSKALFYERHFRGEDEQAAIKFGPGIGIKQKSLDTIIQNTLNNHTVLSTYGKVSLSDDAKPIATLYHWIKNHVHGVMHTDDNSVVAQLQSVDKDPRRRKFYMQMLKKADFNISDFHILSDGDKESVSFVNTTNKEYFELPDDNQSAGTIRYITDLKYLYDAITGSHIYMLDELGEDLHYDLLLYYLNVFVYNSDNSQLIFTSQETSLLAENLFNEHRHNVWFVEKSHDTASSVYTRADDFGLHKNLSLYNSYRIGKLGAKPELGSPFINLD
jgi:AAA15 family ATPase/GTPase